MNYIFLHLLITFVKNYKTKYLVLIHFRRHLLKYFLNFVSFVEDKLLSIFCILLSYVTNSYLLVEKLYNTIFKFM